MKAKKLSTLSPEQLQELFDRSRAVKQEMLGEYLAIEERIRFRKHLQELFNQVPAEQKRRMNEYLVIEEGLTLDKCDLSAVASEITDLLITKAQIEPGPIIAFLVSGRLVVEFLMKDSINRESMRVAQEV